MPSRAAGFTLIELIVAIGIFTLLGLMLVMTLRTAISAWQKGEQSRLVYESARVLTRQLSRDIEAIYPQKMAAEERGDIRFWSDMDGNQRQRLMFVRTLGADERNVMTWSAGAEPVSKGHGDMYTRHDDAKKKLRPHGGLAEVAYVMDPDPTNFTLWRGLRAPVGFPGTLLDPGSLDSAAKIQAACHPVSSDVLYLRFHFWGMRTTSWDAGGNAETIWDSTLGLNSNFGYHRQGSGGDFSDDLWPYKIRIVMTLQGEGEKALFAFLTRKVGPGDKTIHVSTTAGFPDPEDGQGYVLIGSEWIRINGKDAGVLHVAKRGVRGTKAAAHEPNTTKTVITFDPEDVAQTKPLKKTVSLRTKVFAGQTFRIVRDVPAVGEFGR